MKQLKEDYKKRKAIESCITCTLTNFKSQIMRIELTLTCLIKNFPSVDEKDDDFTSQFHKNEELAGEKSSRYRDIVYTL